MTARKQNKTCGIFFLLTALFFFSCKSSATRNPDHPDLLNPVFLIADSLKVHSLSKVLAYLDAAFKKIPDAGPGDLYHKYDFIQRYYKEQKRDYAKALLYTDSMLNVLQPFANQQGYNLLFAEAHLQKGDVLFKQKQFNTAYLEYFTGKKSLLPAGNGCDNSQFMFDYYTRLGNISYGKSRFLEAAAWHKNAVAALQTCNKTADQFYVLQGVLDNVALSYSFAGKLDSALYYYDSALQLLNTQRPKTNRERQRIEIARGVILGNQGTVYFNQGNYPLAEQKYLQSIAINSQKGYAVEDALITQMKLAELYVKTKQLDRAGKTLEQMDKIADTLSEPLDQLRLIMVKANYANETGQNAKAFMLLQQYIAQSNALRNENKSLMAVDFSKEFELLSRQYDLQAMKKKNQAKNFVLLISLLICLMSIALIYLVLKSNRQAKANILQSNLHNDELELTLSALEKSNYENTQLMSVVAHDLKNPINAIYGISELMIDEGGRSGNDMEMLELIRVSSKNLDSIIHDLLASRINKIQDDGKSPADLSVLLHESVALLQYRANEKKQRIALNERRSCLVNINKYRVWRVINNLIVNAIKFSPEKTTITVSWECTDREAIICIKDEGIGIPDELKEKIFLLSADAKRQGTRGEETFGLGLYISKQVVEDQGGRIWLESEDGCGTAFYFTLPLLARNHIEA